VGVSGVSWILFLLSGVRGGEGIAIAVIIIVIIIITIIIIIILVIIITTITITITTITVITIIQCLDFVVLGHFNALHGDIDEGIEETEELD